MSAFLVEDKTINRIVSFLADLEFMREGPLCHINRAWDGFAGADSGERRERAEKLAREMRAMNEEALLARYATTPTGLHTFAWDHRPADPWQVLKSIDCFLYQCAEGGIPERSDLWKRLRAFGDKLCRALATNTAEYNAAQWG